MNLADRAFILLLLPLSLLIYWQICRKPRQKLVFLCVASYLFYSLGSWVFVPLLFGLSLLTFWLARRKRTGLGIVLNLLALLFFKYWNFGAENLNLLASSFAVQPFIPLLQLALPLGISFYVFKHIGYLLDVRQNLYPPSSDFLVFTTFSAFFAQIGAGPISSFADTGAQLQALPRFLTSERAYQGLIHISLGLAKKVLIADALSRTLQTTLFAQPIPQNDLLWSWTAVVAFAIQLYFDFSGYTDIAIGTAYLFGIRLPPNFNNPYHASNPSDFWQRWHISLSTWFRLYLFSPLSRNLLRRTRRPEFSQYTANLVTMLLVGFWHGTSWGFVLWGGYHGVLLNLYAWAKRRRLRLNIPLLPNLIMIFAVLVGWVFFLSPNVEFSLNLLAGMVGARGVGTLDTVLTAFSPLTVIILLFALLIMLSGNTEAANLPRLQHPIILFLFGIVVAFCLLTTGTAVPFIYVQF